MEQMEQPYDTGILENGRQSSRHAPGPSTTSLLDLVEAVGEVVDRMYSGREHLVTLAVYHILGGTGVPAPGRSVTVTRAAPPTGAQRDFRSLTRDV